MSFSKKIRLKFSVILLALFGCSYTHTNPIRVNEIELDEQTDTFLSVYLKKFGEEYGLKFNQEVNIYNDNFRTVIYDLVGPSEQTVIRVLSKKERFTYSVSVYEVEGVEWNALYEKILEYLKMNISGIIIN